MDIRKEMMIKRHTADKKAITGGISANSSVWVFLRKAFLGRYFIWLSGRASRKEWWVVTVFSFILMIVAAFAYSVIAVFYFDFNWETASIEELTLFMNGANLINLFFSIPSMAVSFRRFHDLDMSAWWSLLVIPNLLLPFVKGKAEDNRFGKNIY